MTCIQRLLSESILTHHIEGGTVVFVLFNNIYMLVNDIFYMFSSCIYDHIKREGGREGERGGGREGGRGRGRGKGGREGGREGGGRGMEKKVRERE